MAFLEGVNHLAVNDLGDGVGDYYDCPVFLDGVDRVLDLLRGYSVKRCGRLVQEYDGRVLQEHPGDSHPLLLSSGEVCRGSLKALGECGDLVI